MKGYQQGKPVMIWFMERARNSGQQQLSIQFRLATRAGQAESVLSRHASSNRLTEGSYRYAPREIRYLAPFLQKNIVFVNCCNDGNAGCSDHCFHER